MSNSLSAWYAMVLKPVVVYVLATVSSYWIILYMILQLKFSTVRKMILHIFVRRNGIPLV